MMQKFLSSSSSDAMDSYVKALEEERKKILVFERELPFSLQLVTQAIESCQKRHQQIIGSEEITSEGVYPVLEEFIPLKPSNSNLSSEEEDSRHEKSCCNGDSKPDWLRSVQLWNQEPDPPIPTPIEEEEEEEEEEERVVLHKPIPVNVTKVGAFHPFEREKNLKGAAPSSSTSENNNKYNNNDGKEDTEKEKEEGQSSQRKARRCWSPELHRRFLHALNQLGGSHAATPKQIRELMKVDGLTNDEVKSHLQKYRLHTRRPTTGAVQSSSSSTTQTPQIVLVGGLWLPPPEYTAPDASGAPFNEVYAPVASLPSELGSEQLQNIKQQSKRSPTGPLKSEGRRSIGDDNSDGERTNSDSSATASSSQTTTGSPFLSSHR